MPPALPPSALKSTPHRPRSILDDLMGAPTGYADAQRRLLVEEMSAHLARYALRLEKKLPELVQECQLDGVHDLEDTLDEVRNECREPTVQQERVVAVALCVRHKIHRDWGSNIDKLILSFLGDVHEDSIPFAGGRSLGACSAPFAGGLLGCFGERIPLLTEFDTVNQSCLALVKKMAGRGSQLNSAGATVPDGLGLFLVSRLTCTMPQPFGGLLQHTTYSRFRNSIECMLEHSCSSHTDAIFKVAARWARELIERISKYAPQLQCWRWLDRGMHVDFLCSPTGEGDACGVWRRDAMFHDYDVGANLYNDASFIGDDAPFLCVEDLRYETSFVIAAHISSHIMAYPDRVILQQYPNRSYRMTLIIGRCRSSAALRLMARSIVPSVCCKSVCDDMLLTTLNSRSA